MIIYKIQIIFENEIIIEKTGTAKTFNIASGVAKRLARYYAKMWNSSWKQFSVTVV